MDPGDSSKYFTKTGGESYDVMDTRRVDAARSPGDSR